MGKSSGQFRSVQLHALDRALQRIVEQGRNHADSRRHARIEHLDGPIVEDHVGITLHKVGLLKQRYPLIEGPGKGANALDLVQAGQL